jgi:hypothetical protein
MFQLLKNAMSSPTKRLLRRFVACVPTPYWTRRHPHLSRLEKWKRNALCDMLLSETDYRVFGGPFSTMKLSESVELSGDPRMITGSYELEIQPIVNDVICEAPTTVVDIGAAFGYYAVGFALKIADTRVIAFEAVEVPHWAQLQELARINGVERKISQRGLCTSKALQEVCPENSFILSDCEGAEEDILDPVAVPALKTCKLLVELHEFHRPKLVATLVGRFLKSHEIRIIDEVARDPARYRILKRLPRSWRSVAVEEAKWVSFDGVSHQVTRLQFMLLTPKV